MFLLTLLVLDHVVAHSVDATALIDIDFVTLCLRGGGVIDSLDRAVVGLHCLLIVVDGRLHVLELSASLVRGSTGPT